VPGPRLYYRGDFPVASCPCDDRNLLFHVSRSHVEAGNDFAVRLFDGEVHSGDTVDVSGPFGEFVLHQDSLRPLLFLGCDTGFAPIKSVIEHALSIDVAPMLALYWAATRPDGHYLARQGRAWAGALDNFSFRTLDAGDAGTAAETVAGAVMTDLPDLCDRDIYVAGPPQFVSTLAARLREAGVSEDRMTLAEA
jgi:CDP-4-dehydro-6-deoxyglucose reductase, E3